MALPLFLALATLSSADDLTRIPSTLEAMIYSNLANDRYNEKSCKAPSQTDYIFIWTNKADVCFHPDDDEFVFASYEAYLEGRKLEISHEFRRVWHSYRSKAMGFDSLNPVSGEGDDDRGGISFFIYENLDALYLMGSEDEFLDAVKYLKANPIVRDQNLRTGTLVAHVLGGLLSAYDLSGNYDVGNMTVQLGELLLEAYSHKDEKFPNTLFNLETKQGSTPTYKLQTAEVTQWSELLRLYEITGDQRYLDTVNGLVSFVHDFHPRSMAVPPYISTMDLKRRRSRFSGPLALDAYGFPTHRNLHNAWRQTGANDTKLSDVYSHSKDFFLRNLTFQMKDGSYFTAERAENETVLYRMPASACAWSGQLALDGLLHYNLSEVALANKLVETCVSMFRNSKAGVPPAYVYYTPDGPYLYEEYMGFKLVPDLFESLLHMYRLTHDSVYRTAGYYLYKMLARACSTEHAFSGVTNVNTVPPEHDNHMPSTFPSRAFKYLFLLFSNDLDVSASEFVFSPSGHVYRLPRS